MVTGDSFATAGIGAGVQNAPAAVKLPTLPPNSMLKSVPVSTGSLSEIESKKKDPELGKLVVIVKFMCEPSEEVHAVPAEGELVPDCIVRPVHGLHFPFEGTLKLLLSGR